MGQSFSNHDEETSSAEVKSFTVDEVIGLFQKNCRVLLREPELQAIASKTNINSLTEKSVITPSDLMYLFQLSISKDEDIENINPSFKLVAHIVYDMIRVFGTFPFLRSFRLDSNDLLTMDALIVASVFFTGRYTYLLGSDYEFDRLFFISLSYKSLVEYTKETTTSTISLWNEKQPDSDNGQQKIDLTIMNRILWSKLLAVKSLDSIEVDQVSINAYDLHQLITLFSILNSIPKSKRSKMLASLKNLLKEKWSEFEDYSLGLLRFMDINLDSSTLKQSSISYKQFSQPEFGLIKELIKHGFQKVFSTGFLSATFKDTARQRASSTSDSPTSSKASKYTKFEESRLIDDASISCISNALKASRSSIKISSENLIKLYIGKEAGFSIRSLELKIFKWQAPTLLIVSGKRLKHKTATTNRRYLQFDSEYPRFFRSLENPIQDWQSENDRLTYAVLITQPWKTSNKKNFGNNESLIFKLRPHFDYFKSTNNPVLNGELIYFNTLGFGLGFGNDQPIDKNGVKKYMPGEVSLTIEPNLEFAVFRQVNTGNGTSYFNRSNQPQLKHADFEDRFMITDLEVWGVGSTKELEEQKKQWEWEQRQAEARQSVNLKNMGEERAFLEMVGLVGNYGGGSM